MRPHLALASLIIIAISLSGLFGAAIWEWHERERLGQLHFPISCSAGSQRLFDFATARLHSLNFTEAERAYSTIAEAEPDCAIAYWGIAMSRLGRPVAGSFGSLSQIRLPQSAPPQLTIRTWPCLSPVSQAPKASAAAAVLLELTVAKAAAEIANAIAVLRRQIMDYLTPAVPRDRQHS